jgi:leader peptidase (prepilin peptidase) / N-methyltransferase
VNALIAASGAATATALFWTIAADAAGRRRLCIGTLPPAIPLIAGATAGVAGSLTTSAGVIVASAGAAVAGMVDARTGSIFNPLTVTLFVSAIALAALDGRLLDGLGGCASVAGGLLFLHALSGGRGMGLGDVKLGAGLGAALGISAGITAIALAFIFGGVYSGWLLATKRATAGSSIRFGPFMAAGTYAALLAPLGHPL